MMTVLLLLFNTDGEGFTRILSPYGPQLAHTHHYTAYLTHTRGRTIHKTSEIMVLYPHGE